MSRIRSKDTKIEKTIAALLKESQIPHEIHPEIVGNPDFKVGEKILVFCDGDFWHGYKYRLKKKPPKKFWRDKIERNMKRDTKVSRTLRGLGWNVLRFWEHDIEKNPEKCKRRILKKLDRTY